MALRLHLVRRALGVVTVLALVGGVALAAPAAGAGSSARADAVIGLLDSGINPYHVEFRDRSARAQQHPSTYLPGFPPNATALHLTLNKADFADAVAADCARVWSKVQPGRLYWFPGTKIVGAISFGPAGGSCPPTATAAPPLLDVVRHGTMTASRAAANGYGACRECRIVVVQGAPQARAVEWMTANSSWIDVQSHSWGPLPAWAPTESAALNSPRLVRAIEAGARQVPSFWASGNGLASFGGLLGHPTLLDPRLTPSTIVVGGHDSGYVTSWSGLPPHVVADACAARSASASDTRRSEDRSAAGTSSSTPYAAGSAAQLLIDARRALGASGTGVYAGVAARGRKLASGPLADGVLTLGEWRTAFLRTADPRPPATSDDGPRCDPQDSPAIPTAPVSWGDVPAGFPEYLQIGFGAVNRRTVAAAGDVLRGRAALPARESTETYFAQDRSLRERSHAVWSLG